MNTIGWKYRKLKFTKVKQHSKSCKNCDYFSDLNSICIIDDTSVNFMILVIIL